MMLERTHNGFFKPCILEERDEAERLSERSSGRLLGVLGSHQLQEIGYDAQNSSVTIGSPRRVSSFNSSPNAKDR